MPRWAMCALLIVWTCAAQQPATISGAVIDATTRLGLQGATVRAGGSVTRTDSQGRYLLNVAPGPGVVVAASRSGFFGSSSATARIDLTAGQAAVLDFDLRPQLRIQGTVQDYDTGEAITGCHVFASRVIFSMGRLWTTPAGLAMADTRNGRFEIRNLEPGRYVLEIVPEEVQPITAESSLAAEPSSKFHGWSYYPDAARADMAAPMSVGESGDASLVIKLRPRELHSISGSISGPAQLELARQSQPGDSRTVASGTVARAGTFSIRGIPPGEYKLRGRGLDGSFGEIAVSISGHDVADLRLTLAATSPIRGSIRMVEPDVPLPQGLRIIAGERQVRVDGGKFEITPAAGSTETRLAGVPDGYAIASVEKFPELRYSLTKKTGILKGSIGERVAVLLPEMRQMTGEFEVTLAPGTHRLVLLEGDETSLASSPAFIEAKSVEARDIEIQAGQTTVLLNR